MYKVTTDMEAFGKRLRSLRNARGVSLRWLAREVGCSNSQIEYLENGRCAPGATILAALADVFGLTMDELWRGLGRCDGGPG